MPLRVRIYSQGDPPLRPVPWPFGRMLDGGVLAGAVAASVMVALAGLAAWWAAPYGPLPALLAAALALLFSWTTLYGIGGLEMLRISNQTQLRREVWFGRRGAWMVGHGGQRAASWGDLRFVQIDDAWELWIGQVRLGTIPDFDVPRVRAAIIRLAPKHPVVVDGVGRSVPLGLPR